MKTPIIAIALGNIDDDLIMGAIDYTPATRSNRGHIWRILAAIAACLFIVFSIGIKAVTTEPTPKREVESGLAPLHFFYDEKLYIFSGEICYSLPENYKYIGEVNNLGSLFSTKNGFDGNADGYVYMSASDKMGAYFRWKYWDTATDGKEPYLYCRIREE